MPFNICFEGVSGKRGIFLNGKLVIEVFFLSRPAIDFSYCTPFAQESFVSRPSIFNLLPSPKIATLDKSWGTPLKFYSIGEMAVCLTEGCCGLVLGVKIDRLLMFWCVSSYLQTQCEYYIVEPQVCWNVSNWVKLTFSAPLFITFIDMSLNIFWCICFKIQWFCPPGLSFGKTNINMIML